MTGTARISWADSGSWGSSDATFPNKRGGLYWSGTSDTLGLFAEETASDNLNLVIDVGDDASPSLILRNKGTTAITLTPGSGVVSATSFSGSGASLTSLNASNISSGTLNADRLPTSGATAGSYGPSAAVSGSNGTTMNVPYITVDDKGRITAISNKVYTAVNTWRPLGTGANDAAAGNHNHNGTYVKVAGGDTMTGALTFTSQTSAFNDKNILFSNGGRIGGNIVGEIGIYSAEKVYIKPSSRAASSTTKGVIIDDTGLYPVSTNSDYYLGSSTNKWGNVYGILGVFNGYSRIDLTNQTVDLDTYTLSDGTARIRRYIECTNGGSTNISHLPVTGYPFILDVEAIRYASSTDYITLQTFRNANNPNNEYVRYCTNGTWSNWTTRVFTDTNKYHKSGSWSGLTYTAAAVNSADELKFTIPTGTTATTVALGNHNHDSVYLGINATAAKATADASGNTITTTYATKTEVDGLLAAANAMTFKGTLGTGGTVTALPASHNAGDTYRVITAGTWAGKYCEVGTLIICVKDGTAAADADWTSVETNEDGAVIGTTPTSSTDNAIVRWDGNSGRIIQNSGITIDDNNNLTTTGYINQILLRNVHINNSTSYTTNAITEIFGSTDTASGAKFSILRMQGSAPESLRNNYATGIAWKNSDTHGAISVAYGAPNIKIAGGNGTGMVWWIGLNGTSGQTYTFPSTSKTLAATDGTNASGKWSINTSGKADTAGTADKATAANLATTTNSLAYYTDGTGTFGNTDAYVKYLNHVAANAGTNKAGYIDGLHITGAAYGEAANLISNIAGKMSYGDAGAQIRFTSSGQNGAIIFNHYDNTTPNSTFAASFNFVTDQATGVALKSDGFIINGATTWLRDNNLTFSQGGGWYMNDTAWIRTVGGKSVYMNTGTFRNDGTTQLRLLLHVNPNIVTDGTWETGGTGTDNSGDNYATRGTLGTSVLSIGNAIARPAAGTAGGKNNSKGYLRIYGEGTGYGELSYNDSMFAFNKSIYLTNTTNSGISNEIRGLTATNDYWRIAGGATASNAGYMEIATGDDYNEPIYVRQYSGTFVTVKRTATLLDASGHTEFPVQVTAPKFIGALDGNADSATNISSKLPTLAVATENNEIKVIDLGNSAPEAGLAHRHAIDFRWYNSHWAIGNLRSGSTPSAGFGFSYSVDGTTYSNVAIISNEGEISATTGFKGDYLTLHRDANAQTGKGIDFVAGTTKYGHIGMNTGNMLGIYASSIVICPSLTATNRGMKIEASAITPGETNQIDLGASNNVWKNIYATTFTGNLSGNATTATSASYLSGTSITTEDSIESGTRAYMGSGSGWTGSITSMQYAGILQVCGGYSRGWQIWAMRGSNESLHWRNPNANATDWNEEKIILDSKNYTSYAVAKTAGVTAVTWDATNKKLTRTINGTTEDVMTATQMSTALGLGTIASKAELDYVQFAKISSGISSNSTAAGTKTYWANNTYISKDSIKMIYNTEGAEYTLLFSNNNNKYGTVLKWGYADTYIRMLRYHYNNGTETDKWYSADWERISAGYADKAGSATTATYSTYPKFVGGNEIRFDVNTKPSSATDLYIGYAWSDGSKDAKINGYRFENGNGSNLAKIYASEFIGSLDGHASSASKVSAALNQTAKTYLLGTQTTITATATNVSLTGDTGVYLTTTAGELSALRYSLHYGSVEKAHLVYNNTDDSIDFVFV